MTATDRHQTGERHRPTAHETARHLADGGQALVVALGQVRDPVLIANADGAVIFANDAMEEALGHAPGGLVGFALRNLVGEATALNLLRELEGATVQVPTEYTASLRKASGQQVRHRLRATSVVPQVGSHRHVVVSLTDAQQVETAVREGGRVWVDAEQAFALASRLAGELAHDLNNELAVLLNYSFVLLRKLDANSPLAAHLAEVKEAAWRASRLSQGLFQFGRRHDTDAEQVDLAEALKRLTPLLETALEGRHELDLQVESHPPLLRLPLGRIEQLLMRAAVLRRDLPRAMGPLRIQLSDTEVDGQPHVALTVTPVPAMAPSDGAESRSREGVVTDKIRQSLERFGVAVDVADLGDDTCSVELRIPR